MPPPSPLTRYLQEVESALGQVRGTVGFPFHKHLPDDTLPAERPTIAIVLAEAAEIEDDSR